MTRRSGVLSPSVAALLVALLSGVSAALFEFRGRVPFTSDQGIVSMMAVDILRNHVHPLFCYGSQYGGTLEAHFLALVFGVFSPIPLAFRVAMIVLFASTNVVVMFYTRAAFGGLAGLFAGIYLATGPSFYLYKSLTSDGAYASLLLLLATATSLMIAIRDRADGNRPQSLRFAMLGLTLGLAWWVQPTAAVFVPAVLAAAWLGGKAVWARVSTLLPMCVGLLAGASPWWIENFRTQWASLKSGDLTIGSLGNLSERFQSLLSDALPLIFGGRSLRTPTSSFPGSPTLAVLLFIACLGTAIWGVVRVKSARASFINGLFAAILAGAPAIAYFSHRVDFQEPRGLLPMYLAVAPLVGVIVARAGTTTSRRLLLSLAVGSLGLTSQMGAAQLKGREALGVPYDVHRLIRGLEGASLGPFYAPYWVAYRLDFLSHGTLVASPFGTGTNGFVRHPDVERAVSAVESPAFLLFGEDLAAMDAYLRARGAPSQQRELEGFTLIQGLPPALVKELRECWCFPTSTPVNQVRPSHESFQRIDARHSS